MVIGDKMKRDLYELLKSNPKKWYTVLEIADHFKVSFYKASEGISKANNSYRMILKKHEDGKMFIKFDEEKFKRMI